MRARFYSDTALENFIDEAFTIHEIDVEKNEKNRDVIIHDSGPLTEEITALVQINGGDVLRGGTE